MGMTVKHMKIGAELVLGQYGIISDDPAPVVWLKATPNGDFITEGVVDYICFDAKEGRSDNYAERFYGRPDYRLSNILSFINSDQQSWFTPTHIYDEPPEGMNVAVYGDAYTDHPGFLYEFEDYEIGCLVEKDGSLIRLPSFDDVLGGDRFRLFSRKGVRAHGSTDFVNRKGFMKGFDDGSFIDFWLSGGGGDGLSAVSRTGYRESKSAYGSSGLRPVCTLKLDTVLRLGEDGVYHVEPYEAQHNLFSDEELFALLGMARP